MWFTLLSPALLALAPRLQEAPRDEAPVGADDARALFEAACAASGPAQREPLSAFRLQAEVLTRSGVQTNEARIDYSYLAPDCIRFVLPSKNETGRFGPAPENYWVRAGEAVTVLAGREYKEDRKQVDDMLTLARNYVALSNPARLDVRALALGAPPADLGPALAKKTKKLRWLVFESPDFTLVKGELQRSSPALYRVELGLDAQALPAVAIVREKDHPESDPLLVELSRYETRDDFRLPFQLRVHVLDPSFSPPAFADAPSQEVYVTAAELRPRLSVDDFRPLPAKK